MAFNNTAKREIEKRLAAMKAGWARLGAFWTSGVRKQTKRAALLSFVVEAAVSGLTAFAPSFLQLQALTKVLCSYLSVLEAGKAFVAGGSAVAAAPVGSVAEVKVVEEVDNGLVSASFFGASGRDLCSEAGMAMIATSQSMRTGGCEVA